MTEVQKRRKLIKIIRIQWLVILSLLFAFITVLIIACTTKTSAVCMDEPTLSTEGTDTTESQAMPIPLVSTSEAVLEDLEIISLGEYTLTAYCPCVKCCGKWSAEHSSRKGTGYLQKTASGTIPTGGRSIAVDPSVIPFGTVVIINDHEYIAEDSGGAIKENKIDIFFENHKDALDFGVQNKTIYIKKGDK